MVVFYRSEKAKADKKADKRADKKLRVILTLSG